MPAPPATEGQGWLAFGTQQRPLVHALGVTIAAGRPNLSPHGSLRFVQSCSVFGLSSVEAGVRIRQAFWGSA